MAAHTHKRPYAGARSQNQAPITSYFSPSLSSPSHSAEALPSSPTLPASVQSNLLSVGMRVRKSVPEGYKTGSYSAFTLFSDSSPPSSPEKNYTLSGTGAGHSGIKTRPRARELTPWCGILKVGGLDVQQGVLSAAEDDCPVLSQDSFVSDISDVGNGLKRRFEEDEGDEGEVMKEGCMSMGFNGFGTGRVLAVPRRRKASTEKMGIGQENVGVGVQVAGIDGDFEDADFLDYGSMGEVEMGGV